MVLLVNCQNENNYITLSIIIDSFGKHNLLFVSNGA